MVKSADLLPPVSSSTFRKKKIMKNPKHFQIKTTKNPEKIQSLKKNCKSLKENLKNHRIFFTKIEKFEENSKK
jgi:hypothetical protein